MAVTPIIAGLAGATARRARGRRRAARVLALMTAMACAVAGAVAGNVELSAHRRDEYLQAARLAIAPDGVQLELDLTPGIAVAEAIIATIDRNHDGSLSQDEQRAYADLVVSAVTLDVDGTPVHAQLGITSFPEPDAMRRGEGMIRIQSAATLPRLAIGAHHLRFRNRHRPDGSVYLANALAPETDRIAITAQRRDVDQTELTIDYILRAAPPSSTAMTMSTAAWLGGIAGAMVLSLLLRMRRSRAVP